MMKEMYIAPIAELICLRADAQLASGELDFDDFFTKPGDDPIIDGGDKPIESNPDTDIDLPL